METKDIQLLLSDGTLPNAQFVIPRQPPWTLQLKSEHFGIIEASDYDLFEALKQIRLRLEEQGVMILCAGARHDVNPSRMSRDMGGGRIAYVCRLGVPATEKVDIFSPIPAGAAASVDEQSRYMERWFESL